MKVNKIIHLIVGKPCSGKTSARQYLEDKGFFGYEASSYFNALKLEHNFTFSSALLNALGRDIVARVILAEFNPRFEVVISGFRTVEEIDYVKQICQTRVIGINVSNERCYSRYLSRNRIERPRLLSFEEFCRERIFADYALGLSQVLSGCVDLWIDNNHDNQDMFFKDISEVFKIDRDP